MITMKGRLIVNDLLKQFEEWNDFVTKIIDSDWKTPLDDGKWGIHDVVNHIMFWDKYFLEEAIMPIIHGEELTVRHLDYDQFNQKSTEFGRYQNKDNLMKLTKNVRIQILEAIKSMNEDQISAEYIDADGNKFTVETYVKDFIWHDRHHMNQIEAVLKT